MTSVANDFIVLDDRGRAWIKGANTKVIEVAMDNVGHGWSPEEIHFQHPHLSLAQIHSALSYYHDHKSDYDAEMKRGLEEVEKHRLAQRDTPLHNRLRKMGIKK